MIGISFIADGEEGTLYIDSNGTLTLGTKTTETKLDVKRASIEEAVLEAIRKCCEICDSFSEECSDESHSEAIKKHFGVE